MKAFWSCLLISIVLASGAGATEIQENWVSARAAGMGNAYSGIVSDSEALFYNPAALDRIHGLHLTLLGLNAGTDAQNTYSTLQQATGSSYSSLIHQFYGSEVWANVSDRLTAAMHDMAFGAYDNFNLAFDLHNPAYPNLNLTVANDIGLQVGLATSLAANDAVRVGAVFKRITRFGGSVPFGPSTIATLSNSQLTSQLSNYGTGYGVDLGTLIELPAPGRPTLSGVWQDVGQTRFLPTTGTAPQPIDNNWIVGYSMDIDALVMKVRPAFEMRHINMWNEALGKRLNMGVEFALPAISLRAGANQGYYTLGLGIDLDYLRIDAATYGVELDDYPGQREDRRYIVQVTLDLNFDLNLGFGGKGNGQGSGGGPNKVYYRR